MMEGKLVGGVSSRYRSLIYTCLSQVLTGSYHNYFRIYDVNGDNDIVLQADKSAFKAKKIGGARGKAPGKKEGLQTEGIDFSKKIVSDPPILVRMLTVNSATCELASKRKYHCGELRFSRRSAG